MSWRRQKRISKEFLAQIERIVPWGEWISIIKPHYYEGERGNKPFELPDGAVFCHVCGKCQTAEPRKNAKQKSGGTAYKLMEAKLYRNKITVSLVVPDLIPYCLRHTYGTDLQDAGVPANIAEYLVSHVDIFVTSNIYTHNFEAALQRRCGQNKQIRLGLD